MARAATVLKNVKFLVDTEGHTTAAVVDIDSWSALLDLLEDSEDIRLARERLKNWKSKQGFTPWEEVEHEGEPT